MKQIVSQAIRLMRQHPFHAVISVTGTAVTIAFVMAVAMIYDFRTADMAPEADRSRLMYVGDATTYRRSNHSDVNSGGIGRMAFEALFNDLDGVEDVTWYRGVSKSICGLPASRSTYNYFARPVAGNWFDFFRYEFVAGRPFTAEEYDASRWVCVLTEHAALQLFGTTDVVGEELRISFFPARVVGVVKDVNAIFQTAYADIFTPFSLENEDGYSNRTGGLRGIRRCVLKLSADARPADIRAEVQHRQDRLNSSAAEYAFELTSLYTHVGYTFFRDKSISASLVYGLLAMVLLIVPAINISGMTHAQMQERVTEIAVRKAYGASNASIIYRLFAENLLVVFAGGALGYLLSCLLVWLGRTWLFGTGDVELSGISVGGGLLLRPVLFGLVFAVCLLFNLLSVLLPAYMASRRNIASTLKGEEK
ncbi:ABC transporter permease [Bacteroides heparinolyticus]|uniref:ABC transporter permease n=1 Tax=Prevotella heparinolytica TaxID=28113 RepID=UPI0035A17AAF